MAERPVAWMLVDRDGKRATWHMISDHEPSRTVEECDRHDPHGAPHRWVGLCETPGNPVPVDDRRYIVQGPVTDFQEAAYSEIKDSLRGNTEGTLTVGRLAVDESVTIGSKTIKRLF